MAIKITNLEKSRGIQFYEYSFDVTNNDFIGDDFFNQIRFSAKTLETFTNKTQLFRNCDFQTNEFFEYVRDIIGCPKSVSISINDSNKFAQSTYRYVDHDYTQMCTDLYQDAMKISLNIRGVSLGSCEINVIEDQTTLLNKGIDYIASIVDSSYDGYFDKIKGGIVSKIYQVGIEPGIINNPFTTLLFSLEVSIIPDNYRKVMDGRTVSDISFDCEIDGVTVTGKVIAKDRTISVYDNGMLV